MAYAYIPPSPQAGKLCWITVRPGPSHGAFHIPGQNTLYLPLNPDMQITRAIRTTPTQTIQGAWVDNFGLGVGMLTITGHTGWSSGAGAFNGQPINGYEAYRALWYDIVSYYFAKQSQQAAQPPQVTMQFSSDVDELFFDVMPTSSPNPWTLVRSKTKPYLYQYTLSLIILRDNNHPGAVSPIADPIDPLINVTPNAAVSQTTVSFPPPTPVEKALPPKTGRWTVQAGQTLWSIAATLLHSSNGAAIDTAVQRIAQANHIANASLIYPKQVLTIPYPL